MIDGADLFLGLSGPGVLTGDDGASRWRADPIIFALANPNPEIDPVEARAANPDAIIATGRSDYPNQVNNVLCFPFIFRGALDVGATEINDAMQIACVEGIAALARASSSAEAAAAYQGERLSFGRDYLIPKAVRPAAARHRRRRGRRGGDGDRRRDPAGGRPRGLQAPSSTARSTARPSSCAGCSRWRAPTTGASSSPRARTSGCCTRSSR